MMKLPGQKNLLKVLKIRLFFHNDIIILIIFIGLGWVFFFVYKKYLFTSKKKKKKTCCLSIRGIMIFLFFFQNYKITLIPLEIKST